MTSKTKQTLKLVKYFVLQNLKSKDYAMKLIYITAIKMIKLMTMTFYYN